MSGARLNGARLRFGSAEAAAASVDPVSGRARALAVERSRLRPLPLVFMMRGRVNLDQLGSISINMRGHRILSQE